MREGEMNCRTMSMLIAAMSVFLGAEARAGSISLTGAVVYDGANDGIGWTSSTVPGGYRLYIAPNSAAANFINAPDATINYNLSPGQNVFYIFGFGDLPIDPNSGYGPLQETFGLNLFINETAANFRSTANLSGTTASNYGTEAPFASNPLTATTPGSLTYITGGDLITMTLYNFDITITQYNRVSAFSPTPYVGPGGDAVGEFILDVSTNSPAATPLPSTWLMLLSGFVGLGCFAYPRRKNSPVALAV
jgi:hypothetical protein